MEFDCSIKFDYYYDDDIRKFLLYYDYNLKNKYYIPGWISKEGHFVFSESFYEDIRNSLGVSLKQHSFPFDYPIYYKVLLKTLVLNEVESKVENIKIEPVDIREEVYDKYREIIKLNIPIDIVNEIIRRQFYIKP